MKKLLATSLLTLSIITTPQLASAAAFKEGALAVKRSDGAWSFVFSFVNCNGTTKLGYHKDRKLNRMTKIATGGYLTKFNHRKYRLTFFTNGIAKKRDGSTVKWRYATASELKGKRQNNLAKAKAKCR